VIDQSPPLTLEDVETIVHEGAFEHALSALELVVEILERGRLSIDDSVSWYEAGLRLAGRCSELLSEAELRITTIEGVFGIKSHIDDVWTDDE
jgi:exodeoxyribonuclease VII small subunit